MNQLLPGPAPVNMGTERLPNCLYIGDIPKKSNESELYELFSLFVPVNIRLCRNLSSRLNHAYITFYSPYLAQLAQQRYNFFEIEPGVQLKVQTFEQDRNKFRSGTANIFARGLDKAWMEKDLYEKFKHIGNIKRVKIARDQSSKESKGYGYVQFSSDDEANKAIAEMNGKEFNNIKIEVMKFLKKGERSDQNRQFNNLYVKNFPSEEFSDKDLKTLFEKYGSVKSAVVMKDSKGRGFGFICFEKADEAARAVEELSKEQDADKPDEKKLYVRRALKKHEREEEVRQASLNLKIANARSMLHVRSFTEEVKMEDLKAFFEKFGELKSMSKKSNPKAENTFAVILNFKTTDSAKRAKTEIEGGLKFNNIELKVEQFQPKELRDQKLQEDYFQRQVKKKIQEQLAIQMSFAYMPFLGMPSMDMFGGGGQYTPGARYQQQQYYNQRPGMPGPPHYPQRGGIKTQGGLPMNKAPYVKNQGSMGGGQRPQGPYNNQYQKPQGQMMMPGQNQGYPQGMPQSNQQLSPQQQYPPRMPQQPVGLSPQSIQHQQQKQEPQVSDFYTRIQFYANQIFQSQEYLGASEDEKKNQLGELYYEIAKSRVDEEITAGKIVGLLLSLDLNTLGTMLMNPTLIEPKISEALAHIKNIV